MGATASCQCCQTNHEKTLESSALSRDIVTSPQSAHKVKNSKLSSSLPFIYLGAHPSSNKEGFGIIQWSNGSKFSGYFHNNEANGYGIYSHPDNGTYKGN